MIVAFPLTGKPDAHPNGDYIGASGPRDHQLREHGR
jgi:hypothetical protein